MPAAAFASPSGMPGPAARQPGLAAGRLPADELARRFAEAHPPLTPGQALVEAERCWDCHDAPCVSACPTGIEVPRFIARIAQGNLRGAAKVILQANPLGGMCARVCPTETLCEQACVRQLREHKPVEIGLLQRYATDAFFAKPDARPLFTRAAPTGKTVAVVGAGPAGLAAAHGLARRGHDVVLFEARPKLGGMNEYGLASYKTTDNFAQREVQWLLSIGGITVKTGQRLGSDITLSQLVGDFDAVFLGLGLAGVNTLGLPEPNCEGQPGLRNAVDFIAELRQAPSPAALPVGRQVVVIGGGMTAVDAAVQSKLLGAREVTMVYRRGVAAMSASGHEQAWAQNNGVVLRTWATPKQILSDGEKVTGVVFAVTALQDGKLVETGEQFTLQADLVLKAIGQSFVSTGVDLKLEGGRIATDAAGRSSHPKVWAGGDCRFGGRDLTVEAVEHGKQAAIAIDQFLSA